MSSDSRPGPAPAWNGLGFGMAAIAVATLVILYAPTAPEPDVASDPTSAPGQTITLDELDALLSNDHPTPETVDVVTDDGTVTVLIPPTTTTTTTTTPPSTTTAPTTTAVPLTPRTPDQVADDILDDLTTTIPEGAGGVP